jgi:UDPglucose 6-dehydrogenase
LQSISVVGAGYVGLSTSVGFASKGYKVLVYDTDQAKLTQLCNGLSPFFEPELDMYLRKATNAGMIAVASTVEEAVKNTDLTFITVGSPSKSDGTINLNYITESVTTIGNALNKKDRYHLIAVKSTVVPGTTENFVKPLLEKCSNKRCGPDFGLCMNPEFLQEGSAVHNTLHPDRVIIGEFDKKSGGILNVLFREFYAENTPPILRTNLPTAELIKYANNAFLATKISYINTIANICEKIPGTDVTTVAEALGLDQRINPKFLNAGLGYGGSCFTKDLTALVGFSTQNGYLPILLQSVQKVNDDQSGHLIGLIKTELSELAGKNIAILGLSFKPNTDDMRGAISISIVNKLLKMGVRVRVYDPKAIPNARKIFKNNIKYCGSPETCLKDADCCVIVTEWNEIKKLKPEIFKQKMKKAIVIDGRRTLNPLEAAKHGIVYYGIGYGRTRE